MLGHKFGTDRSETTTFSGNERYEQITSLLMVKTEGRDRISGVVNPTELHRWIEMNFFFCEIRVHDVLNAIEDSGKIFVVLF
ncbi:hypothetical protein Hanom_Chr16g01434681 [Helianthus anomalus]